MDPRRPRLGDNIDDYCPRERRLANHVVVAIIGDEVKQTRCTTCDTEHPFKNAKVPPRRKTPAAAARQPAVDTAAERPRLAPDLDEETPLAASAAPPASHDSPPDIHSLFASLDGSPDVASEEPVEEGPVHRRLIRAQLPRIEGEVPTRPIPEFTMRQPQPRPGRGFGRQGGARSGAGGFRSPAAPGVMSSGTWSNSNGFGDGFGNGNGSGNANGNARQRQKSGNGGRPGGRPNGFNKKSR